MMKKFGFLKPLVALSVLCFTARTVSSSIAGTETLVGIAGRDFIMLGADSSRGSSGGIALTSSNVDKIVLLCDPLLPSLEQPEFRHKQQQQSIACAAAGDAADSDRLLESLSAHIAVREYESGIGCDVECVFDGSSKDGPTLAAAAGGLDVESVAHLARAQIASSLRSYSPLRVCLLLAGMVPSTSSETTIPKLFWLDEYGSLQNIKYGAHGYGSNFALSILDRGYKRNMSRDEAARLIQNCFDQLRVRYVINSPQKPCIKCIDAKGCTVVST